MPPPTSPSPRKRRRKRDDPQSCLTNSEEYDSDEASPTSYAEVERFQGKVVYNLDGKAYIIDSENELSMQLSDSSIKDVSQSNNPKIHSFRVISSRDATMNSSSSTQSSVAASVSLTAPSADPSPCTTPSLDNTQGDNEKASEKKENNLQRQQKPILMCFICKLSFGNTKLFSSHANSEHKLNLSEPEKVLLCREYSSAIIQKNNDENSQISFLEPLDAAAKAALDISKNNLNDSVNDNNDNNNNSNNNHDEGTENDDGMDLSAEKADINKDSHDEHQPRLTPKSLSSLTGRTSPNQPPALNVLQRLTGGDFKFLNTSADLSQLTNFLEQHKTLNEFFAQQQNQQEQRLACPEHADAPNLNDIDCKNCEFLNINQMNSPLILKSPIKGSFGQNQTESNASSTSSKTSSPITSSVTPNSLQLHQNLQQQSSLNTSPSFTIGACPDHMNGRPIGVDCARCEILLNSARLNSGVQISTRNSCKTLKCPQCNWHYKYQETLEIHMREKHPDGESACGYCLAGAAHPRLARGESYTCGYKPYRCEICNYSTTTKGNLSIHMQSDKHLNNVQELSSTQNLSVAPQSEIRAVQPPSQPTPVSAPSTPLPQQCKPKPKPSFRCEPCSYETPNARNYRIHETSEKHTHNLAVVQCNIKRLQSHMDSFLQQSHAGVKGMGPMVPSPLDQAQSNPGHLPGAALADLAYNQALLIQLLHQNSVGLNNANTPGFMSLLQQQQQQQAQTNQQNQLHYQQMNGTNNQDIDQGLNPDTLEPPFEQDFNPIYNYSCLICSNFNTNDLEELNNHINEDRSRLSFPQEFIVVVNNNNYTCRLCCYKTHLKANCQLHCKTDKHLQRVNFANHIKQGGLRNEYKFEYVINSTTTNNNYNITQLKCNCCDYYTNSIQKLNCHIQNVRHESMKVKFNHVVQLFKEVKFESIDGQDINNKALQCQLCNFKTNSIMDMVKHNKSLRHIQIEQIYCLQRRCESLESMDIGDVYQLVDDLDSSCSDFAKDEEKQSLSPSSRGTPHAKSTTKLGDEYSSLRSSTPMNVLKMFPFEQLQQLAATLPSSQTILKCNQCDHLTENKIEMEQHFDQNHPNNHECNSIVLPSMAALMAAAQMNFEPKIDQIKNEDKSDDLTDKMLDDSDKGKQNCEADVMTIEPDIDGVIINNSSRSSSAVSMLEGDEKVSTGAMRTTPQNQHIQKSSPFSSSSTTVDEYSIMCPLCQESFTERKALEQHVMCIHSVNADGLNRLLQLVDTSHWLNNKKSPERSASVGGASSGDFECLVCSDTLKNMNDLLMHATDHQHFTIVGLNQFGCLLKSCHQKFSNETQVQQHFRSAHLNIVISERHVYKYRCPMCPLAFKTEEKLNNHFMYHTMRDATKCNICSRNFRSTTSLQRHVEQVHGSQNQDLTKSSELTDDEKIIQDDAMSNDDDQEVSEYDGQNSEQVNEESSAKRFKAMKRNDKITNYSLEKYHDPNRPYKCDDCFESFTQANILTVHKNSVSHLHRVKQKQKESRSGSSTPALGTSPNQIPDFDRRSVDFDRKSVDYEMEISNSTGDTNKRKLSSDDYDSPKKRFKCDICKVAYAQGSTLDIHMRSVGHQAKTNRIMQQQLQQGSSSSTAINPQDLLQQHLPSNNGNLSPKLANNAMYKTLLENFGFDIVKQFNDINKIGQTGDLKSPLLPQTPKKNGNSEEKKEEKIFCRHCKQFFANIFILKAHCEEVHGEKLSLEMLAKEQDSEVLDFSQVKAAETTEMTDPMKHFSPEMLQQKAAEQKFDPAMLAQRLMEQQFLSQFPQISQSLQNLSTGSLPMNTLEMLNLMQFHHFMSLNFMNLAPPLIFGGAQQGNNLLSPGQASANPILSSAKSASDAISPATPSVTPSLSLLQQQQQQASSSQLQAQVKHRGKDKWNIDANDDVSLFQACGSQKRARTRITDDQLKILRSHFDINNSPSEESILEMSKKANLPQKVVKHWFRNTLFKERQRNKDSPYNFANPPSTTLNLEEYERTGQTKTTPLSDSKAQSSVASQSSALINNLQQQKLEQQKLQEQQQQFFQQQAAQAFTMSQQSQQNFPDLRPISQPSSTTSNERDESYIKSEPMDEMMSEMDGKNEGIDYEMERFRQQQQQNFFLNSYETKSESGSSDILSRPQTPNSLYNNINDVISQQIESIPINNISGSSNMNQMGPPKKFQLNKIFDKSYESNSSSSNSSTSSGKRANRTRFTDYQIKVLQEFFENNSYPKDSDLEYLSKLLLLSPRVIVVWFQNARQKQRKIYENQPNSTNTPYDAADEKKSACINYTCKKCNLIFQRYYELIRHQKNHCFKEENNKKSAKAQIAAAQIAQSLSSEDSNSSLEINHANNILGNNLLHPVTSTTKSQQNLAQCLDAASETPPLSATKMNLNHPVNLITTTSGTHPNIMQPLDFHPQSPPHCHNQSFEVDPRPESLPNFKPAAEQPQLQQQIPMGALNDQSINQHIPNPYDNEQMQEFLMQKFSTQDFDLLTKNYDFFLQYYKTSCPNEQQMDEKHLTMDFLSQFYHLNEFKKKLNCAELEPDENVSGDEMQNDNDDVVALDDKEELDFNQQTQATDTAKGKMGISNFNSNKRLRTTILPEQLNYLYECYQKESNPSRKQLEEISKKVNLKKRVVQVWYQNSRARERKGQFRQNMQIINKKCPYCSAIFKVKSALESHLQTKHIDKQMVNIDAIPEISYAPKEIPFAMQMPSVDVTPQIQNMDYWKAKMMQQPQTSQFFGGHKRLNEFSESEISFTDSNNDELCDEDYDMDNFNDDSNHAQEYQSNTSQPSENNKSKRHRTHVNRVQKSILRKIFDDVKSPSMIDCENIGREIGLFKRVVQVWFQNARANYKKCHKISTNELKHLPERNPQNCQYCPDYNPLMAKTFQSHALSQQHIQNVHNYVMKNETHPDEDDDDDCHEVDTKAVTDEPLKFHPFNREMSGENREANFQMYTNCHPQKSLLVGDMQWIE